MPHTTTAAFGAWLKENTGIKLSSDNSVSCLVAKGFNNYKALLDFDKKSLQSLPATCKEPTSAITADATAGISAQASVANATITLILVQRLIVTMNAVKYYSSINRTMNLQSMHWLNVLTNFQLEWLTYESLKDQDDPKALFIVDKDSNCKVIKWSPIFLDCLSCTFGSHGPLSYVLYDDATVPSEVDDPLLPNAYYGSS